MKAILINPPSVLNNPLPTLGLAYLSSALREKHHDALILDLWAEPMPDRALHRTIETFSPDIIGISFYTVRYRSTVAIAEKIRRWFPNLLLVAGGPHASAMPKSVLTEIASLDLVVYGEGEITINEVIGAAYSRAFEHIDGIAYRKGESVLVNKPRKYVKNLDSLPYPDLFQMHPLKYRLHAPFGWYGSPLIMLTSRGCPGKCIFCSKSVFKNSVRAFSPQRIIEEIKYWRRYIPFQEIKFYDDDFTMLEKRTHEICSLLIKEKINLPWSCTTRVDFLTRDMLAFMKASGLYFISLGVESGSPGVLKTLKKGYTVEHIRNAFQWCHELGITTFAYFMVGNPGETKKDIQMTIDLQKEIKPNFLSWSILRIVPGSPLFEQCQGDEKYHFGKADQYFDIFRKDVTYSYLNSIQKRAMLRHYLSPFGIRSVFQYLMRTRNFGVMRDFFQVAGDKRNKNV